MAFKTCRFAANWLDILRDCPSRRFSATNARLVFVFYSSVLRGGAGARFVRLHLVLFLSRFRRFLCLCLFIFFTRLSLTEAAANPSFSGFANAGKNAGTAPRGGGPTAARRKNASAASAPGDLKLRTEDGAVPVPSSSAIARIAAPSASCHASSSSPEKSPPYSGKSQRARRRRSAQTRLQLAHGQASSGARDRRARAGKARGVSATEARRAARACRRNARARSAEPSRALGSVASRDAGRPRRVAELVSPEGPARAIARGGPTPARARRRARPTARRSRASPGHARRVSRERRASCRFDRCAVPARLLE